MSRRRRYRRSAAGTGHREPFDDSARPALTLRRIAVWIIDPPGFGYSDKPTRSRGVADQATTIAGWLAAGHEGLARPGAAGTPVGRRRARLLGWLHQTLGDQPSLRLLNVAEYCCASLPRAVGTLRSALFDSTEEALQAVHAPTLIVRADQDRLSTIEWAKHLAALAPAGRLERLAGLGHAAFVEAPDAVATAIAAFLT